jgi:hypothetical protein
MQPAEKQVIVVVHGVGIRDAGEATDLVAGALEPDAGTFGWRRRASDDFRLFEAVPGTPRIIPAFPARISRFRWYQGRFFPPDCPERVIADFYWGDIWGFSGSMPATFVGLGRVMLGLVHVVRENAGTVFPGHSRRHVLLRALARGAGLAIHGPIFAANIALVFGLVGVLLFGLGAAAPTLAAAAACLGTGIGLQLRARTFLLRYLGAWLGLFGLLLAAFLAAWLVRPGAWHTDALAVRGLCSWMDGDELLGCLHLYTLPPFLFGLRLQAIMVALWAFVALVATGFGLRWLIATLRGDDSGRRDILMPSLALMSLLWFLLTGLFWAAASLAYSYVGPGLLSGAPAPGAVTTDKLFSTSQRGIWASLGTLAITLAVVTPRLLLRRGWAARIAPEEYMQAPDRHAHDLRLIVSWEVKLAMLAMPLLLFSLMAASVMTGTGLCILPEAGHPLCRMEGQTGAVVSAVLTLAGLAGAPLLPYLSQGLNVAGDVIIYLNDFWWRRSPDEREAQTFAEALLPPLRRARAHLAPGQDGYVYRQRIQCRLEQFVDDLIASEEPQRLDIVCHSQGTVIALDVLCRRGADWGAGRNLGLVTMGSPWRHLYHQYFPQGFAVPPPLPPEVKGWTNVFRVDDFIGTHVRDDGAEVAMPPAGHSHYWRDAAVRPVLRRLLD